MDGPSTCQTGTLQSASAVARVCGASHAASALPVVWIGTSGGYSARCSRVDVCCPCRPTTASAALAALLVSYTASFNFVIVESATRGVSPPGAPPTSSSTVTFIVRLFFRSAARPR